MSTAFEKMKLELKNVKNDQDITKVFNKYRDQLTEDEKAILPEIGETTSMALPKPART